MSDRLLNTSRFIATQYFGENARRRVDRVHRSVSRNCDNEKFFSNGDRVNALLPCFFRNESKYLLVDFVFFNFRKRHVFAFLATGRRSSRKLISRRPVYPCNSKLQRRKAVWTVAAADRRFSKCVEPNATIILVPGPCNTIIVIKRLRRSMILHSVVI